MKLTKEEFRLKVDEKFTGVIDFYANWCNPCKAMAPMLDKINEELGEEKIFKLDIDDAKDIAKEYSISSIPTLIFFKDGEPYKRIMGMTNKKAILENLNTNL